MSLNAYQLAALVIFTLINTETSIASSPQKEESIKLFVIDGHNDLPWALRKADDMTLEKHDLTKLQSKFHTDLIRLKKGGVGAQFWSAYVPASTMFEKTSVKMTIEQIDLIHRMIEKYPDHLSFAGSSSDILKIHKQGMIASLIGVEGGHSIAGSLAVLRTYYKLGVRYMTLTHSVTLDWVDSASDEQKHNGITSFGKEVISEMNRLGMFIDISHVSDDVMRAVLKFSKAPVIASHSSARRIADHSRNIPDDILKQLPNNGGVIMVNFYSGFVDPEAAKSMKNMFEVSRQLRAKHPKEDDYKKAKAKWMLKNPIATGDVHTVVRHIDHIVKVAGIDHVGMGADYDGVGTLPKGLEDVSTYPTLAKALRDKGYKTSDVAKIMGGNLLRAMAKMESVANGAK